MDATAKDNEAGGDSLWPCNIAKFSSIILENASGTNPEASVNDNMIEHPRVSLISDVENSHSCFPSFLVHRPSMHRRSKRFAYRHPLLSSSLFWIIVLALAGQLRIVTARQYSPPQNDDDQFSSPYVDTPVAARLTTTAGDSFYNATKQSTLSSYPDNSAATTTVADDVPPSNYLSDMPRRSRTISRKRPPASPSRFARFSTTPFTSSSSPKPSTIIPDYNATPTATVDFDRENNGLLPAPQSRFMMLAPETKKSRGSRWWKIGLSKRPEDFSNLTSLLISADGLKSSGGFYYNYAVRKLVAENNNNQMQQYANNNDPDASNMIPDSGRGPYRSTDNSDSDTITYRANMLSPLFLQANGKLFNRKQRHLLKHFKGSIFSVAEAAELAINECQYQFRGRQWNCPIDRNGMTVFGNVLDVASRETAFIYSLTSAALAYSVARGCKQGTIEQCSCNSDNGSRRLISNRRRRERREDEVEQSALLSMMHEPAPRSSGATSISSSSPSSSIAVDYVWRGCSDNFKYGDQFARRFTNAAERGTRDSRSLMNKHNNKAGNWHVGNMMERRCKCHGMSGSCTVQTCWMQLPPFRAVADRLKDRFDGASRVLVGNRVFARREPRMLPPVLTSQSDFVRRKMLRGDGGGDEESYLFAKQQQQQQRGTAYETLEYLQPYDPQFKPPTAADLVYLDPSPDFCEQNPRLIIPGTHGRPCNETSQGMDGCELMCCHRGYRTVIRVEHEKCRCKFKWCCKVECEVCRVEYRDVFCN